MPALLPDAHLYDADNAMSCPWTWCRICRVMPQMLGDRHFARWCLPRYVVPFLKVPPLLHDAHVRSLLGCVIEKLSSLYHRKTNFVLSYYEPNRFGAPINQGSWLSIVGLSLFAFSIFFGQTARDSPFYAGCGVNSLRIRSNGVVIWRKSRWRRYRIVRWDGIRGKELKFKSVESVIDLGERLYTLST